MPYLKVTKTSLVRRTPLGTFVCFPYGFRLESFFPIMEIDEDTETLLNLCDGTRTREEILQILAEQSGESVEEIAEGFDEFVEYMEGEHLLEWVDKPSPIEPLYKRDRPFGVTVDITSACNLHCDFCAVDAGKSHPDDLTMEDITQLTEQIKELKPSPVALSGGEPLLRKDIVLYMLEELSPIKEITVTIFTNGTLITKEYAQELYDAGLRVARVSLDGHTAEVHDAIRGKGTFEKTLQGIKNLRELGIHVDVVPLITRTNYQYLKEIKAFADHISDSNYVTNVAPYGRANSDILLTPEEVFNVMAINFGTRIQINVSPRVRCNTGETCYITSNGDIFPCFYMHFPEFKVGNIRENDLCEIYKTDLMQQFLGLTLETFDECATCDIRYYCGGGCRGWAYALGKSLHAPDLLACHAHKTTVCKILENGEETTQQLLQELLKSTEALG